MGYDDYDYTAGIEWAGEHFVYDNYEVKERVDASAKSLVRLMGGSANKINRLIEDLQVEAESMTKDERKIYFEDLDEGIMRMCD